MHKGINTTCDEGQTLIPTRGGGFDDAQQPYSIMPMNSGKDYKARETDVAQPIMAGGPVGGNQGGDFVVAHSLRAEGFDASEDCSPTLRAGGHTSSHPNAGVMPAVAYFDEDSIYADAKKTRSHETLFALLKAVGAKAFCFWEAGGSVSLQTADFLQPGVHGGEFRDATEKGPPWMDDRALPRAENLSAGAVREMWLGGPDRCSPQERELARQFARKLAAAMSELPHQRTPHRVRRLTPREAERLMGFPDDFTKIPWRGKPADQCPDGPRYKALGNSMAVNVMCWIGERIAAVEAIAAPTRSNGCE